jgi:hypothetical protein
VGITQTHSNHAGYYEDADVPRFAVIMIMEYWDDFAVLTKLTFC